MVISDTIVKASGMSETYQRSRKIDDGTFSCQRCLVLSYKPRIIWREDANSSKYTFTPPTKHAVESQF